MQPDKPNTNDAPDELINNHEPTIIRPSNPAENSTQQETQTPPTPLQSSQPQPEPQATPQPQPQAEVSTQPLQPDDTQSSSTPPLQQATQLNPAPQQPAGQQFQQQQPTQQPTGVPPQPFPHEKQSKKKLVIGIAGVTILLLIGSLGYVFGIYLPNTPENVWKTSLPRTGQEVEAIVDKLSDPEAFSSLSKNKLTVSGGADIAGDSYTLDVNSAFDKKASDSTLDFTTSSDTSSESVELNAKVKTQLVEDSLWPNIYFSISGISSLGLDAFLPGISDYDGKWIAVEQDFYGDIASEVADANSEAVENVTQQDIVSIANDVVEVAQDYLFTADPEKAIIMMDEFVGSEESEGITAYHYKASQNLENTEAFCKALANKLIGENEAYRKINSINENNTAEKQQEANEDCTFSDEEKESFAEDTPVDIWMDKGNKILHKVRTYEDFESKNAEYREEKARCEENYKSFESQAQGTGSGISSFCDIYDNTIVEGEQYEEFGQVYDGNDTLKLFINQVSDTNRRKDSLRSTLTVDINTLSFNGQFDYENTTNEDRTMSANFTIKTEAYDGEIDATRPADAIDLQTLLEELQLQPRQSLGDNTENQETVTNPTKDSVTARETFVEFLKNLPIINLL